MPDAFKDRLKHYLADPSSENFRAVQETLAQSPEYAPYSGEPRDVYPLLEQGQFKTAQAQIMALMPNWFLNPGVHKLLSFISHQLGDEQSARFEFQLAMFLLEGILSTGDGSQARPYRVLHTADEYDILEHLDKQAERQSLAEKAGRYFDRQDCIDGTQLWFDITWPYSHLQQKLGEKRSAT